jgi:hypothetical protein
MLYNNFLHQLILQEPAYKNSDSHNSGMIARAGGRTSLGRFSWFCSASLHFHLWQEANLCDKVIPRFFLDDIRENPYPASI